MNVTTNPVKMGVPVRIRRARSSARAQLGGRVPRAKQVRSKKFLKIIACILNKIHLKDEIMFDDVYLLQMWTSVRIIHVKMAENVKTMRAHLCVSVEKDGRVSNVMKVR